MKEKNEQIEMVARKELLLEECSAGTNNLKQQKGTQMRTVEPEVERVRVLITLLIGV